MRRTLLVAFVLVAACAPTREDVIWPSRPIRDPAVAAQIARFRDPGPDEPSRNWLIELTAYRPRHGDGYHPFRRAAVRNELEVEPGVGIRVNGDDDNDNGVPDLRESGVSGEDDLIEVRIDVHAQRAPPGATVVLAMASHQSLRVWADPHKRHELSVRAEDTVRLENGRDIDGVFVEWNTTANRDVTLEARLEHNGRILDRDRLRFYPLTSAAIFFGGFNRAPPNTMAGLYLIAQRAYEAGYDAYMFASNDIVRASRTLRTAIESRDVTQIATLGHSSGAFTGYALLDEMAQWQRSTGRAFSVPYTASIDANLVRSLKHPPALSTYHVSYYQHNTLFRGQPVRRVSNHVQVTNVDVSQWDDIMSHRRIDNHVLVQAAIVYGRPGFVQGLAQRVAR